MGKLQFEFFAVAERNPHFTIKELRLAGHGHASSARGTSYETIRTEIQFSNGGLFPWGFISVGVIFRGGLFPI